MSRLGFFAATFVLGFLTGAGAARADTILWVSDASGNIGEVDVTTKSVVAGSVHPTGLALTGIAFTADGTMYGTTSSNLYRIDPATGNATNLGGYGPSFTNVKGLTGFGSGLLLASDSAADDRVMYAADPATPSALTTYATSIDKSVGGLSFISDGGLGFYDGSLYEAGQNVSSPYDYLIDVSTDTNLGLFDDGDYSDYIDGGLLTDVAGLVSDGTTLYAVIIGNVY